jgi:hypothetical protein
MLMHNKVQISRRCTFEIDHTALSAAESLWLRSSYAARTLSVGAALGLPRASF